MPLKIKNGQTILFIGDSITDCGRRVGSPPLGDGFVKWFNELAAIREPAKKFNIINKGIGGDSVTGLRNRWADDVLRHKPDWLSIMIGINDLHSQVLNKPCGDVNPTVFEEAYDDILSQTKKAFPKCRILLIDPFLITLETNPKSFRKQLLDLLPGYIRVVHAMSKKYITRLVKMHDLFQKLLKYHEPDVFCGEPAYWPPE